MAEVIKTISFVDGTADFATVQAAWDSLPADITAAGTDENFIFEFISEGEVFEPISGTAVLLAQNVITDATHDIVFRRRAGIKSIHWKGTNTTYALELGPLVGALQEFVKVIGVSLIDGSSRTVGLFAASNCVVKDCRMQGVTLLHLGFTDKDTANNSFIGNLMKGQILSTGTAGKIHTNLIIEKNTILASSNNPLANHAGFLFRKNYVLCSNSNFDWKNLTAGSIIENNVFIHIFIVTQVGLNISDGVTDLTLQHNLFVINKPIRLANGCTGVKFFNNIFAGIQAGHGIQINTAAEEVGFRSDGNAYINERPGITVGGKLFRRSTTDFTTLASWRLELIDGVNPDLNSIEVTAPENDLMESFMPKLEYYRDSEKSDLKFPNIVTGSAIHLAGIDRPTTEDYYGVARNDITPSIGPVEEPILGPDTTPIVVGPIDLEINPN